MVWVVLAMALLWAWGVSREDTTYAPPQQQASQSVSSAQLLFIDGPKGRIDVWRRKRNLLWPLMRPVRAVSCGILRSLVRERKVRDIAAAGLS